MVESFEETKGHKKGRGGYGANRGYGSGRGGDRGGRGGGRGGDRGGRGGGGFGSAPKQAQLVSSTPPGAINLLTNHFKLRVKN